MCVRVCVFTDILYRRALLLDIRRLLAHDLARFRLFLAHVRQRVRVRSLLLLRVLRDGEIFGFVGEASARRWCSA